MTKPRLRRTLVVMLCAFVPACATVPYRLGSASAGRVETAKVRTQVAQQSVSIEVLASGYGGHSGRLRGMLVGAMIDAGVESSRSRDAERRIRPLRSAIQDLDHPARLWEKLVPGLQSIDRPEVVDVLTSRDVMPVTADDVRDSAFVSLATSYDLSPDASVLEMHTDYWFYLRGSTQPAAIGSVSYWSSQIGRSPDGETWQEDEEAIALWAANAGAAYRAALDEGIAETVKMLRIALPFAAGRDVASGRVGRGQVRRRTRAWRFRGQRRPEQLPGAGARAHRAAARPPAARRAVLLPPGGRGLGAPPAIASRLRRERGQSWSGRVGHGAQAYTEITLKAGADS